MLEVPDYIRDSGVIGAKPTYKWEGTADYNRENPQLFKKLFALAPSAILAIGIGSAEWVYWRLSSLTTDKQPLDFIEASWAFSIDPRYANIPDVEPPKRTDILVAGPLFALTDTLSSLLYAEVSRRKSPKTANGAPPRRAVVIAFLARHVLPKPKVYDDWLKVTIERLGHWQPRPLSNEFGEPVPREYLDPKVKVDGSSAPRLLATFLRSLDWKDNPFLRSPDDMKAAAFAGEPYRTVK